MQVPAGSLTLGFNFSPQAVPEGRGRQHTAGWGYISLPVPQKVGRDGFSLSTCALLA